MCRKRLQTRRWVTRHHHAGTLTKFMLDLRLHVVKLVRSIQRARQAWSDAPLSPVFYHPERARGLGLPIYSFTGLLLNASHIAGFRRSGAAQM